MQIIIVILSLVFWVASLNKKSASSPRLLVNNGYDAVMILPTVVDTSCAMTTGRTKYVGHLTLGRPSKKKWFATRWIFRPPMEPYLRSYPCACAQERHYGISPSVSTGGYFFTISSKFPLCPRYLLSQMGLVTSLSQRVQLA